jgi:hypothetical protein
MQIVQELQNALGTKDVACVIDAKHLCVNSRGIMILKVALSLLNWWKRPTSSKRVWIILKRQSSKVDYSLFNHKYLPLIKFFCFLERDKKD